MWHGVTTSCSFDTALHRHPGDCMPGSPLMRKNNAIKIIACYARITWARDPLHNSCESVAAGSGWAARRLFAVNSPAIDKKTTWQTARVRLITGRRELCRRYLGIARIGNAAMARKTRFPGPLFAGQHTGVRLVRSPPIGFPALAVGSRQSLEKLRCLRSKTD